MRCDKELLIKKFFEAGIIKRQGLEYPDGFKLKSGKTSDIYINIRDLIKVPTLFNYTMQALYSMICDNYKENQLPCILGIPTMGAVIAPIIAYKKAYPLAVIRQRKKDHGLGNDIEGTLLSNVIMIDDVITTGSSIEETVSDYLKGTYDVYPFVIVDRQEHRDVEVWSLMTLEEIRQSNN